jgi:chromosome segregation ATPase
MNTQYGGRKVREILAEANLKSSWSVPWEELSKEEKNVYAETVKFILQNFAELNKDFVIYQRDEKWVTLMTVKELEPLLNVVDEQSKKIRYYDNSLQSYYNLYRKICKIIEHYECQRLGLLAKLKNFKDDVIVYLRALAMVANSVSNADTHAEKNARLRGMLSQLESAIKAVKEEQNDFLNEYWGTPDLFRSDYPIREYVQKIRNLESKLQSLKLKHPESFDSAEF